jgi:hypothetical protein
VSNFIQTRSVNGCILTKLMEGVMHDSRRYRDTAAECLLASQEARNSYYRDLFLSMAASWLSLAQQDEILDNLFPSWDTAKLFRSA